jgi:hypothetical protein
MGAPVCISKEQSFRTGGVAQVVERLLKNNNLFFKLFIIFN